MSGIAGVVGDFVRSVTRYRRGAEAIGADGHKVVAAESSVTVEVAVFPLSGAALQRHRAGGLVRELREGYTLDDVRGRQGNAPADQLEFDGHRWEVVETSGYTGEAVSDAYTYLVLHQMEGT